LIRDSAVNKPVGYISTNEHNENAIMLSILADVKSKPNKQGMIDTDQKK
jgi:hypothetical protein